MLYAALGFKGEYPASFLNMLMLGNGMGVMSNKERDTNIELLRILCMLGIIAHHAVIHGGGLDSLWSGKAALACLVLPAGKIGFTCFLAISMWFLSQGQFHANRFARTWLEVLFYTVGMTIVAALLGTPVSLSLWIGSFLPIGGISHGFAAAYLAAYLLLPVLSRVANRISRIQSLWLIGILGYCQIIETALGFFGVAVLALHPFASEIILFVWFFFAMNHIRRWHSKWASKKSLLFAVVLMAWGVVTLSAAIPLIYPGTEAAYIASVIGALNPGENGVINIIGGIALFLFARQIGVPNIRIINRVATFTFGVLLFHDHNVCRECFWSQIVPFGGMAAIWELPGVDAAIGLLLVTI